MIRRKRGQAARHHREARTESLDHLSEHDTDLPILEFDEDRQHMAVGWNVWDVGGCESPQELLNEYLAFVYSIRGLEPGTAIRVERGDLEVLESVTGWSTDRISSYLVDLMLKQSSSRRVQTSSRAKEKTRDTLEDIMDWWNGVPGT